MEASLAYGFIKVKPNSKRWEKERYNGIGASESSVLWGLNKYVDSLQWFVEKVKKESSFQGNFKTLYGLHAEDTIMKWAEKRLGTLINPKGIYTYQDIIRATPDRTGTDPVSGVEYVVDAKNSGAGATFAFKKDAKLPIYYWTQAQQQMQAADRTEAFMVINYGNEMMCYYRVYRNDRFLELHSRVAKDAWRLIDTARTFPDQLPELSFEFVNQVHANVSEWNDQRFYDEYIKTHYPWHIEQ